MLNAYYQIPFQSTRPRGARQPILRNAGADREFQSTRPRGARRASPWQSGSLPRCFNPRAHAGRDEIRNRRRTEASSVSIHAPTRGATSGLLSIQYLFRCFNPRAHAGRDWEYGVMVSVKTQFQSTRPRGARPSAPVEKVEEVCVSIHAPTRGATRLSAAQGRTPRCFNPRAHAGRDGYVTGGVSALLVFQSTRPRGARQSFASWLLSASPFQSTRPRGARHSG